MTIDSSVDVNGVRVCVVCMYYWPELSGSAPYVTGMSEHLASRGAAVTVVTGVPHYPEWRARQEYRSGLWSTEHHRGVRILRSRPYVPGTQTALHRAAYEASWLGGSLLRYLRRGVDVVLASSPPLAALPLAWAIGRLNSAPVGVIIQDFYGSAASQSGVSGGRRIGAAVTWAESALLRSMDLVGVIDEGFVPTARDLGVRQARIRTLPNWTHIPAPRLAGQQARQKFGWDDGLVRVVHTGNMGHKQGLENVVEAARLAVRSAPNHKFVLVGEGNQRRHLQELGEGLPSLEFMPAVDHEDYPDLLQAADVLLVNERPGATEMSLPSKVTSYLATDRPLLAAVPDGVTRSYLKRLGVATIIEPGDPQAMVDAVVGLADGALVPRRGTSVPALLDPSLAGDRYARFCRELLHGKHSVDPARGVR